MRARTPIVWTVAIVALILLAAINLGYRVILNQLHRTIDDELGEQLSGLAESFAATVEPAVVTGATAPGESFSPNDYLRLWSATREFALANRLVSVTILDTLWQDTFAEEGDSLGRMVYALLDREGDLALRAGLPWVSETFRWEEDYYRSAAAPIFDATDSLTVGMVRLEADAVYFTALERLRVLAWWIHGLSAVFAIALGGLFAWSSARTRRWEAELLRSEKLIGLGRLAATIAHEIKNPLGIIKATAQRLAKLEARDDTTAAHRQELLRFIPEEADRLDRILTGYLSIDQQPHSAPIPISMEENLPRWLERAPGHAAEGRDAWEVAIEPTGPILADPDTPRQVLLNLLQNALDATPDDQTVTVNWRPADDRYGQLTVADHGPGVPRALRRRVFEPFYTTKTKGSGLGLYAVQMMVTRDGGTVTVADNPGGGAIFTVRWPLAPRDDSQREGHK